MRQEIQNIVEDTQFDNNVYHDPEAVRCSREDFELKPNHEELPLWICKDGSIYLEAFSPLCAKVTDFLIAIAEPQSRPNHIHQYKLTPTSLYAAASIELTTDIILRALQKYSKNLFVPQEVRDIIELGMKSYGKAKLILQDNKYYIEADQ